MTIFELSAWAAIVAAAAAIVAAAAGMFRAVVAYLSYRRDHPSPSDRQD